FRSLRPLSIFVQLAPPSLLTCTPVFVPTYTAASTAMHWTVAPVSAVACHVPPASSLLKTPPPAVPAYTVPCTCGSTASARGFLTVSPSVPPAHFTPPFELR